MPCPKPPHAVPDSIPIIDISKAETWHGIRPGMLRSEVVRAAEAAGLEVSDDETDPEWLLVMWDENSLELLFAGEGEQPLRQIILDDESSTWKGRPVIGQPLHEALANIGDDAIGAGWRPENTYVERFEDLNPLKPEPVIDESLIYEGTLWLPRRNFGLVMCEGIVNVIVWRRLEDFPWQFVGSVTEAQKTLTARADCKEVVRERVYAPQKSGTQSLLVLAFILALAFLGWQALLEQELSLIHI